MIKPGDVSGRKALLKSEELAEKSSLKALKSLRVKPSKPVSRDSRTGGRHFKGFYN